MTTSDLAGYQTCYFVEKNSPSIDDMPAPVAMRVYNPNANLKSFMIHPPGLEKIGLFEHMCRRRNRDAVSISRKYNVDVIDKLDLAVSDRVEEVWVGGDRRWKHALVSDQLQVVLPTPLDLTEGAIMREIGTKTASVKMPQRVLNTIGEINAYSTFANDPERVSKLRHLVTLAVSVDRMKAKTADERAEKKKKEEEDLEKHVPTGISKLQTNGIDQVPSFSHAFVAGSAASFYLTHTHTTTPPPPTFHCLRLFVEQVTACYANQP